jgi:oligopeptide transport system ATP-binding protein
MPDTLKPNPQPLVQPGCAAPLLEVNDLKVHFPFARGPFWRRTHGVIRAVDGVSFTVQPGETLGIVGESGSGKSTLARGVLGLVPITAGTVRLEGKSLDYQSATQIQQTRRVVQMIFQDPFASLNPRMTVGKIIAEPLEIAGALDARTRRMEVLRLMELVGLNPKFLNRYPHEFSGGQRQRIGIARALAVSPKLIFCDEPVSALDVSIRAQIINLLMDLQQQLGVAYIFIAHDLSIVRHISQRVGVMYLGRLVEVAPAKQLFADPRHPYTQALLSAVPIADPPRERTRQRVKLVGEIPSPDTAYPGCPFADRCPIVSEECRQAPPQLVGDEHQTACIKVETT